MLHRKKRRVNECETLMSLKIRRTVLFLKCARFSEIRPIGTSRRLHRSWWLLHRSSCSSLGSCSTACWPSCSRALKHNTCRHCRFVKVLFGQTEQCRFALFCEQLDHVFVVYPFLKFRDAVNTSTHKDSSVFGDSILAKVRLIGLFRCVAAEATSVVLVASSGTDALSSQGTFIGSLH